MYYGRSVIYAGLALLSVAAWAVKRRSLSKRRSSTESRVFLGIDCSTQSLTAVVIDENKAVICERSINFNEALSHYGVVSGVIRGPNNTVSAPTVMFIEALDLLLDDLRKFIDVNRICAVSGCAQQHGAVFWLHQAQDRLSKLNHCFSLGQQLKDCFAITHPPIWMDCSTSQYCRIFEGRAGGAKIVSKLSGSRAYERFTGIQIAKIISESKEEFDRCGRISLISSMLASLFIGRFAAIDQSDASGMNLMDIDAKRWSTLLVGAAAQNKAAQLIELLGEDPVSPSAVLAPISEYFVRRYGFSKDCQIVAFTGDNPSTLAGLGISVSGDVAISLGTSDTLFAVVPKELRLELTGSILVNPVNPETNMLMLTMKNGAFAREEIRNRVANGCWETFSRILKCTEPGNSGYIGFFWFEREMLPDVEKIGVFIFDAAENLVNLEDIPPTVLVRAIIESQFLSMLFHAKLVGVKPERLSITGGASVNNEILTICANVFGAPVYVSDRCRNTAAFGSALRAQHCYNGSSKAEDLLRVSKLKLMKNPDQNVALIYEDMLTKFGKLLAQITKK